MDKKFAREDEQERKRKMGSATAEQEKGTKREEEVRDSSTEEEVPDLIDIEEEEEEEEVLIHSLSKGPEWKEGEEEIDKILDIVWDMRRDRLSVAVEEEKFS